MNPTDSKNNQPSPEWNHCNPVKVVSGVDITNRLDEYCDKGNLLFITSAGFTNRGITERVVGVFRGETVKIVDTITPNPQLDDLDNLIEELGQTKFSGIVALGGGSVLDAAKAIAVTYGCGINRPLAALFRGGEKYALARSLPLIAIPTTSGTGSEVTPFATVWDCETHKKHSLSGPAVYPDYALLDPALTCTLPRGETLSTSLDAISHALESLWNNNRTPVSRAFATRALRLANTALPKIREAPHSIEYRATMQEASLLAGLAISQTRTAIAHSISYPLTSWHGVPHGLACSFTLPAIIDLVLPLGWLSNDEIDVVHETKEMLQQIGMSEEIQNYLTLTDAENLIHEMYLPDRAGNFCITLQDGELSHILNASIFGK